MFTLGSKKTNMAMDQKKKNTEKSKQTVTINVQQDYYEWKKTNLISVKILHNVQKMQSVLLGKPCPVLHEKKREK
jgi:hypothetical protein